ncbi:hypothetical protein BC827DRAFT_1379688, partial [Russula dissimulans]
HDGTTIEAIAFLIAFAWHTILSGNYVDHGNTCHPKPFQWGLELHESSESVSDKTIAVIDGSGVLADPAGINREELIRLAKLQVPIEHFSKLKLSKDGYLVRIKDQGVKLPSSEAVLDGTDFHNAAYLHFKGDLFVPCGGDLKL